MLLEIYDDKGNFLRSEQGDWLLGLLINNNKTTIIVKSESGEINMEEYFTHIVRFLNAIINNLHKMEWMREGITKEELIDIIFNCPSVDKMEKFLGVSNEN